MAIYGISDLHLSFGTNKPMDVFGNKWKKYEDKIKEIPPEITNEFEKVVTLQVLDNYSINNNYTYALVTIHPDNIYSIKNILKDNFELINTIELKRGTRNIYLKKL